MEPATGIEPATCGLRVTSSPTSDNLTPPETTNQNAPELGADGCDLSCPGNSMVAAGIHGGDQNENKSGQVETTEGHDELDRRTDNEYK